MNRVFIIAAIICTIGVASATADPVIPFFPERFHTIFNTNFTDTPLANSTGETWADPTAQVIYSKSKSADQIIERVGDFKNHITYLMTCANARPPCQCTTEALPDSYPTLADLQFKGLIFNQSTVFQGQIVDQWNLEQAFADLTVFANARTHYPVYVDVDTDDLRATQLIALDDGPIDPARVDVTAIVKSWSCQAAAAPGLMNVVNRMRAMRTMAASPSIIPAAFARYL